MTELEMLEIDCEMFEGDCLQMDIRGANKDEMSVEIIQDDSHTIIVLDKLKVKKVLDYLHEAYKLMK